MMAVATAAASQAPVYRSYLPVSDLPNFRRLDSHTQGHPEPRKTPRVEVAAGPLGHGVAVTRKQANPGTAICEVVS